VRANSLDLLQADHILSGIDMALWDLMGKKLGEPVYKLLGYSQSFGKTPYASMLFGDTPQETLTKGRQVRAQGYRAAKFGWGPIGKGSVQEDVDQFMAAREGLGEDGILLIDIGTAWLDNVEVAAQRVAGLEAAGATWLEEPFVSGALDAYKKLASMTETVKLAGGEGSHNFYMAQHMIDYASLGYVQIDAGRIGGISVSKQVADYARQRGVTYVNHTFTSHLALSASLQPFAGLADDVIAEYPVEPKALALAITSNHIERDGNGQIHVPDAPGLGMTINPAGIEQYLVPVTIAVAGKVLYQTARL
jgi:L-alanine-DL-glutamate epimerase-like enolase superfamily enzyme